MAQFCSHELLELLHHGDAGAGSSAQHGSFVDEKPSLNLPAKEVAGEAEMASWLCEVFQQEASDPRIAATTTTTTTTTKSEGESTKRGSGSSGGAASMYCRAASDGTQYDERPRSSDGAASGNRRAVSDGMPEHERPRSSGRRRSSSGKAAEQVRTYQHACRIANTPLSKKIVRIIEANII
jgi:hypothetical protein